MERAHDLCWRFNIPTTARHCDHWMDAPAKAAEGSAAMEVGRQSGRD